MSLSSTAQNAAVGSGATGSGPEPGRRFVVTVTLLTGVFMVAAGAWALLGPDSFADAVRFPRHVHFVHDAGAFQLGIGIILLLGATWRDGLALALAGLLVANSVHAVNHAVDLNLGGRPLDPWGLAALSLLTAAALVVRLRQLGWVIGEVGTAATPALAPFVRQKTVLLTTYRRDGRPASSPVTSPSPATGPLSAASRRPGRPGGSATIQPSRSRRRRPVADRPARLSVRMPGASTVPRPGTPPACWPASTRCCTACWCR